MLQTSIKIKFQKTKSKFGSLQYYLKNAVKNEDYGYLPSTGNCGDRCSINPFEPADWFESQPSKSDIEGIIN